MDDWTDHEDMSPEEFDARIEAGEPMTISVGPTLRFTRVDGSGPMEIARTRTWGYGTTLVTVHPSTWL